MEETRARRTDGAASRARTAVRRLRRLAARWLDALRHASWLDTVRQASWWSAIPRRWLLVAVAGAAVLFVGRWVPLPVHVVLVIGTLVGAGAIAVRSAGSAQGREGQQPEAPRQPIRTRDAPAARRPVDGRDAVEARELFDVRRAALEVESALEGLRTRLGAARTILWDVSRPHGVARPRAVVGGEPPRQVRLAGDPVGWASEERIPLRLTTPPVWAFDLTHVALVPLDQPGGGSGVLSIEVPSAKYPLSLEALERTGAELSALLRLHHREGLAAAAHERYREVVELLRELPRNLEPSVFASELAVAAAGLVGATGAVVASWESGSGRVLAVAGDDGGPKPGATFGPLQSELALAASAGAAIVREDRAVHDPRALPVAAPDERWFADPRSLAVYPLNDPTEGVLGLLALWSADSPALDREKLAAVEALAPYAAILLLHTRQYDRMHTRAEYDALTGLHNRRAFDERLAEATAHFARYRRPVAMILVDIDHFKNINDRAGHEAGDDTLRAVGEIVRSSIREADFAARYGGEEFVVLLPETGLADAAEAAERLRRRIEDATITTAGGTLHVTASFGVCAAPDCVSELGSLVRIADAVLYESKKAGRNRVTTAPIV